MATTLYEFKAMASPFRVQIDYKGQSNKKVQQQFQSLFHDLQVEVEQLEERFSRFRSTSELTRFNEHVGEFVPITPEFKQLLTSAEEMHQLTDGAFDPRVLEYLEVIGYTGAVLPTLVNPKKMEKNPMKKKLSSTQLFEWNGPFSVCTDRPIDMGGIGKGYAADLMADSIDRYLSHDLLSGYIVDAGGDLVIWGCQSNGEPWSIGVENPFAPQKMAAVISVTDNRRTAICTSSLWKNSWRFKSEEVHHLIDPSTGKPMQTSLMSVTVVSPRAILSEAITKYVFLRGITKHSEMQETPWSAILIDKNKCIHSTKEPSPPITWLSSELSFRNF